MVARSERGRGRYCAKARERAAQFRTEIALRSDDNDDDRFRFRESKRPGVDGSDVLATRFLADYASGIRRHPAYTNSFG